MSVSAGSTTVAEEQSCLKKLDHRARGEQAMEYFRSQGLIRPRQGRILGGVCAGLGRRFGVSPWMARILFVAILLIVPGSQIIVYPILWILMPSE